MILNFLFIAIFCRMVETGILHTIRQILLFHVMIRLIMGILVSQAVS